MLWRDDFVSQKDWKAACEALDLSEDTQEIELRASVIVSKTYRTRGNGGVQRRVGKNRSEPKKAIAIDFDGCLCHNAYPEIGAPNWDVISKARVEQKNGAGLILWTCREGELLQAAIDACTRWGLELDAVNESLPEWIEAFGGRSRKAGATEYWDDRAIPVHNGWLCDNQNRAFVSPFKNDPFAIIGEAFRNLYPEKHYEAYWEPMIRDAEDGAPALGMTDFADDGTVSVFIKPDLEVNHAVEIFAHELAHVAVGLEHNHDETWENAFESIFQEYNKLGDAMFGAGAEQAASDCN